MIKEIEHKSVTEKILEKILAGEIVMQDGMTDSGKLKAVKQFIRDIWADSEDVGIQCFIRGKLDRNLSASKFNAAFRSLEQRGLIATEVRMLPATWEEWRAYDGYDNLADDNGIDSGIVGYLWTARIIALDFPYLEVGEFEVIGSESDCQGWHVVNG